MAYREVDRAIGKAKCVNHEQLVRETCGYTVVTCAAIHAVHARFFGSFINRAGLIRRLEALRRSPAL